MRLDEKISFTEKLVHELMEKARKLYPRFKMQDQELAVRFDLTGASAGMAGYTPEHGRYVNFNRRLMQDNWDDYLRETIAHEVAHIVAFNTFYKAAAHGPEWKGIMRRLGYNPSRCHAYDISAASNSKRYSRKHLYVCGCNTYSLSFGKHKKEMVRASECPLCEEKLVLKEE